MKDPKYLGIPNINFSLTSKEDEETQYVEFSKQRIERGFDDSETWSLDMTIAKFILPRLIRLKELKQQNLLHPGELNDSREWSDIMDKMIFSFKWVVEDSETIIPVEVNEGLDLFREYFFRLWW